MAKGYDYRADLKALKHYIREFRPVLVGVDGGADVLRDAGYRPDLVIGELDEMSDAALRDAGEVVAHADHHGRVERAGPGAGPADRAGHLRHLGHQRGRGDAAGRRRVGRS